VLRSAAAEKSDALQRMEAEDLVAAVFPISSRAPRTWSATGDPGSSAVNQTIADCLLERWISPA